MVEAENMSVGARWETAPIKGPKLEKIHKDLGDEVFQALNGGYERAFSQTFSNYDRFSTAEEKRPHLTTTHYNPRQLLNQHFQQLEKTRDQRVTALVVAEHGDEPEDKNSKEYHQWQDKKNKLLGADKNIQAAQQEAAAQYLRSLWVSNTTVMASMQQASNNAAPTFGFVSWVAKAFQGKVKDDKDLKIADMNYDDSLRKVKEMTGQSSLLFRRKLRPNAKDNDTEPNPDIDCTNNLDSRLEASTALIRKVALDANQSEILLVPGTEDGIANMFAASMLTALSGDYIGVKMDPDLKDQMANDPRTHQATGDQRSDAVKAIHQDFNDMMHSEAAATGELATNSNELIEQFMMHQIEERGFDAVKQAFAPKSYGPYGSMYAFRHAFTFIEFTPSCQDTVTNKDFASRMKKAGMADESIQRVLTYGEKTLQAKKAKHPDTPKPDNKEAIDKVKNAIKDGRENGLDALISGEKADAGQEHQGPARP